MQILLPVLILTALGALFGAGLAFAGKKFAVGEDPKVAAIREALPGANCGACGFPGCAGLATAIAEGEAPVNACPVGGADCAKAIASVMGVEAESAEPLVATVICQGAKGVCQTKYEYEGIADCRAAALASGGPKSCRFACLGLGTCAANCPFDAIRMENGIAVIDSEKCTGCKTCIAVCPKSVLRMEPRGSKVYVKCHSTDKARAVRAVCSAGCIACGLCVKACKFDAIHLENNLPVIDYDKCTQCLACAVACPTSAIVGEGVPIKYKSEG